MTTTIDPTTLDSEKLDAFMGLVVSDFAAAASTTLVYVGDKLGIYAALVEGGPQTPAELASRTGLNERLLLEWLSNQVASAYVDRDQIRPGMIEENGPVVRAFASIGWEWGGNWENLKDYQHFSQNGL